MALILETKLSEDGMLTAVIVSKQGTPIAGLLNPVATLEEALVLAWEFEKEHPELFPESIKEVTEEQP